MDSERAERIVVSYPDGLGAWRARQLTAPRFVRYLRKTLGTVSEGLEFEEFVDVGCCGNSPDIPLRVETVEGGALVDDETQIEFVEREETVESGWEVQSAAGPSR